MSKKAISSYVANLPHVRKALARVSRAEKEKERRVTDAIVEAEIAMSKNPEKAPLSVRVENGQLVISIGVATLAFAAKNSPEAFVTGWDIADATGFAKEVVGELNREEENGSTRVHRMLDEAMGYAVDHGCQHIEEAR